MNDDRIASLLGEIRDNQRNAGAASNADRVFRYF
jgi:hypothetical protein